MADEKRIEQITIDPQVAKANPKTVAALSRDQLRYSTYGLILGLACVLGGIFLFLIEVTGNLSWTAKFLGSETKLLDAAPGALLFIIGLYVVYATRYNIKIGK